MKYAFTVTLDCNNLEALAAFWMEALHYRLVRREPKFLCLGPPEGVAGTRLVLQEVLERKQGKNRMHMDVPSLDLDADRVKLLRLGAVELRRYTEDGYSWVVLVDPEGNEFCLVRSGAEPPA